MVKKIIPQKVKKVVNEYVNRLAKEDNLPIDRVIVFGSYAKGEQRQWSDIDVCIISPKFKDNLAALEYLWRKRNDKEVEKGLEPIGFSDKEFQKGSSLIREISETGVVVK